MMDVWLKAMVIKCEVVYTVIVKIPVEHVDYNLQELWKGEVWLITISNMHMVPLDSL